MFAWTPESWRGAGGVLALAILVAAGACATGTRQTHQGQDADTPDLSGVWEGLFRANLPNPGTEGGDDTRIERQAWQLEQQGRQLRGFYVVELTMVSGDGRAYLCSQTTHFSTLLRFEVQGRVTDQGVELHEVGPVHVKGPCRPGFRSPAVYRAAINGNVMTLTGAGRTQTLYRRTDSEGPSELAATRFDGRPDDAAHLTASFPDADGDFLAQGHGDNTADLHGYWVWENQIRLPNGDIKREREEWHLQQEGLHLTGFYDRAVEQQSTDGQVYRCNGQDDFRVVTRYTLTGMVSGPRFVLREHQYEILEGGPCDDGQRRLDAYQGEARPDGLHLLWSVGRQILKRSRPDLPTQRF